MTLCQCTTLSHPIVVLVDVDNTLLDNDRIQQDLKDHLERAFGLASRERYWRILEDLFTELPRLYRSPPTLPGGTPAPRRAAVHVLFPDGLPFRRPAVPGRD
jgi:hypothetical protein